MAYVYFTTNAIWQAPLGVSGIMAIGAGGGGGGGCANSYLNMGGGGGGGSWQQTSFIPVLPMHNYQIIIGNGGAGGFPGPNQADYCGLNGESTVILKEGKVIFKAVGGGGAGQNHHHAFNHGGKPWGNIYHQGFNQLSLADSNYNSLLPSGGGACNGPEFSFSGNNGLLNGFQGGISNSEEFGAGGGGAGPQGNGGAAGNSRSPNGVDAAANSGAGGGGGNLGSLSGGRGGSGYLYITWSL